MSLFFYFSVSFLFVVVVVSSFALSIVAHEATHLAFAEMPSGVCFGVCSYYSKAVEPVCGFSVASSYGYGFQGHGLTEELPVLVQLTIMAVFSFIGGLCLARLSNNIA